MVELYKYIKAPKRRKFILLCIMILLALLGGYRICQNRIAIASKAKAKEDQKDTSKTKPSTPKKTSYYCIDDHRVYYRKKKEFATDPQKLKTYFRNRHELNYKFKWIEKEGKWYLDTSSWKFSFKKRTDGMSLKVVRWGHRPCSLNKTNSTISCPVASLSGILWKISFKRFQGGFLKVKLYRVPISKEAKQKQQMARFFGVKTTDDIDICLQEGNSPIQKIISESDSTSSEDDK